MRRLLCFMLLAAVALPVPVKADSYQVNAAVPYDIPSDPPVISSPIDATTSQDSLISVTGTCQHVDPSSVISIWRNGVSVGSALCSANQFSVQVALINGANVLVPRLANLSNVYGPDGSTVTVFYTAPALPENPPTVPTVNPDPAASRVPPLTLTTSAPFAIINEEANVVSIDVIIAGGETPYSLVINWGDGSTDNRVLQSSGNYRFSHTYLKAGLFSIRIRATDVRGAVNEYTIPAVSVSAAKEQMTNDPARIASIARTRWGGSWLPFLIGGVVVMSLVLLTFLYGRHSQMVTFKKTKAKRLNKRRKK